MAADAALRKVLKTTLPKELGTSGEELSPGALVPEVAKALGLVASLLPGAGEDGPLGRQANFR